jgi:hypothetical protein
MSKKIGFVGLETMGFPMADNLKKAGFEVIGYDAFKGVYDKAKTAGMKMVDTLKEVAEQADEAMISMVRDHASERRSNFTRKLHKKPLFSHRQSFSDRSCFILWRSRSITSVDSIYHGGRNKLILSTGFVAEVSSMKTTANNLKVLQIKPAITTNGKWHLLKVLFWFNACLPAFSGCSSLEGTGKHQRVAIRLLKV